jgi:hypothetical protein
LDVNVKSLVTPHPPPSSEYKPTSKFVENQMLTLKGTVNGVKKTGAGKSLTI